MIKIGLISFLLGVVVTSGAALYITRTSGNGNGGKISETTISGNPLLRENTVTVNHSTVVDYSYAGPGESQVVIPWDSNPWGYNWSRKTWMITGSLNYFGSQTELVLSRRMGAFSVGAGVAYDWKNAKVYPVISASYMFER
jgi:hypothetical protein